LRWLVDEMVKEPAAQERASFVRKLADKFGRTLKP
jgi:hypothetical protein